MAYKLVPLSKATPAELHVAAKFAGLDEKPKFASIIESDIVSDKEAAVLLKGLLQLGYVKICIDPDNRLKHGDSSKLLPVELAEPLKADQTTPSRVAVETKIGRIVFRAKPNGAFICRLKGYERIRIRQNKNSGLWEADGKSFNRIGAELIVEGKSPDQVYKRAVMAFWF